MRTFAVGAVLAVGLLAGCGGTTDAGPPPSPSTTAPSPSPSPTAPAMPDAARENTKAGALAFVKFYIASFNHAQATGDVSTLRKLGAEGCVSCEAVVRTIARTYASGGHVDGGMWVMTGHAVRRSEGHQFAVYVNGRFRPADTFRNPTSKHHNPGGPILATFYVRNSGDWRVTQWTRS